MVIDKSNMKEVLKNFPNQCREAIGLAQGVKVSGSFTNIVTCGMGGSAVGGEILRAFMAESSIPVTVLKDYEIPKFVNENTLCIAVSYSGNTEETLSAVTEAKNRGATVVGISSGGQLSDLVDCIIKVPGGLQPRNALGYLFFPVLGLLFNSGIIEVKNSELNDLINLISNVEEFEDQGKKLALKIKDKTPIIYSSTRLSSAAYRFKTEINENGKHPCFVNNFPELCHNELVGFEGMDRSKYIILLLRSTSDHERIIQRMDICSDIFDDHVDVEQIKTRGTSLISEIFSVIYLAAWTSYHLAMWKRVDPSPVHLIENLKRSLME